MARLFRNPFVVVAGVLGDAATAFQLAGVTTVLMANIILISGVWIFVTVEVLCSKWIKKTRRYSNSLVLLVGCLSGVATVCLSATISELKYQQNTASQPAIRQDGKVTKPPATHSTREGKTQEVLSNPS